MKKTHIPSYWINKVSRCFFFFANNEIWYLPGAVKNVEGQSSLISVLCTFSKACLVCHFYSDQGAWNFYSSLAALIITFLSDSRGGNGNYVLTSTPTAAGDVPGIYLSLQDFNDFFTEIEIH